MKTRILNLMTLLTMAFMLIACGEVNKLTGKDDGRSDDGAYYGGTYASGTAQQVMNQVQCGSGYGGGYNGGYSGGGSQQRYSSTYSIQGSFHDGYMGYLQPGSIGGAVQSIYVGVSSVGDVIEVQQLQNGNANVVIHMCDFYPLITSGRGVTNIQLTMPMVVKARPDCQVNEITSAGLYVGVSDWSYNGGYFPPAQFPVVFSRFQDYAPQLCNNGGYYY